ncbi:hypothetical protein Y032_0180g803 [Ancylostoma ceylanicum]|uniref:Uncharacterized protein n=1 Tax=Ancylostoma ceylanicum TaxID=53326 RepID=A0A016STJ2_9BILA|nr:hypothetical protein Y032_0180g803 [Ancylostoma ceylanicum]
MDQRSSALSGVLSSSLHSAYFVLLLNVFIALLSAVNCKKKEDAKRKEGGSSAKPITPKGEAGALCTIYPVFRLKSYKKLQTVVNEGRDRGVGRGRPPGPACRAPVSLPKNAAPLSRPLSTARNGQGNRIQKPLRRRAKNKRIRLKSTSQRKKKPRGQKTLVSSNSTKFPRFANVFLLLQIKDAKAFNAGDYKTWNKLMKEDDDFEKPLADKGAGGADKGAGGADKEAEAETAKGPPAEPATKPTKSSREKGGDTAARSEQAGPNGKENKEQNKEAEEKDTKKKEDS